MPRRDSPARRESKLLLASRQPLTTKLRSDNIVGDQPAGIHVSKPGLDFLNDVQMVDDILKAAIIRQPIEKILHPLLRC